MNQTRHGRSATGATRLGRIFPAAVGLLLTAGLVLVVCGFWRRQTLEGESPPDARAIDPVDVPSPARLTANSSQALAPLSTANATASSNVSAASRPKWPGHERLANYQDQADILPVAEEEPDQPLVLALPAIDESDLDAASQQAQRSEPPPHPDETIVADPKPLAPDEVCVAEPQPADNSKSTSSGRLLPPDFAAAFAVQPKHAVHAADRLALLSGPSEPTPQLIAVAQQADQHIARGVGLAERGATYTARAEFLRALRLAVAALDEQKGTVAHARALANGLRALEEAEDFLGASVASQGRSIKTIVAGHQSPILNDESVELMTPAQALQRYLNYAQDELAAAAGDLQPAATALYSLGKLALISESAEIGSLSFARAAVYLQAALIVNPQHAPAANELGVLLARHGRLEEAKASLLHSVRTAPLATAWHNLSTVHRRLGEHDLAGQAEWESRQFAGNGQSGAGTTEARTMNAESTPAVQWVDPATFARTTNASSGAPLPPMTAPDVAQPVENAHRVPVAPAKNVSLPWTWPWTAR